MRRARGRALARDLEKASGSGAGGMAHYDELRARRKSHSTALRQAGNRLVGILHGYLEPGARNDEHTAWGTATASPNQPPPRCAIDACSHRPTGPSKTSNICLTTLKLRAERQATDRARAEDA
jgi:hypothetical protein